MSNLVLRINCAECIGKTCCSANSLRPILMPSEEKNIALTRYVQKIKTPYYTFFQVGKKGNDQCIYFNQKTKRCSVYNNRPLECQIYPFMIEFDENKELKLNLDKRYCRHLNTLEANKSELTQLLKSIEFPEKFIKGFNNLAKNWA